MNGSLSPIVLSMIQHSFIDDLGGAFVRISKMAQQLFYIVAGIELALFGLVWALRQQELLGTFLLKIFKLGLIFFIITMYPQILQALIDGFSKAAFMTVPHDTAKYLFNPAEIWRYGFDTGISLLNLAVSYGTSNDGITLIYVILGFGILLLFALIMAQIILVVVTFYVVALLALLLIPLGAFTPTRNLFERAIESVFSAGARVYALIIVLGVAVSIWSQFNIGAVSQGTTIDVPLGMFCVTLVFWVLMVKLPGLAARAVGRIGGGLLNEAPASNSSVQVSAPMAMHGSVSPLAQMAAATSIQPGIMSGAAANNVAAGSQVAGGISVAANVQASSGAAGGGTALSQNIGSKVREGASVNRGISRETLNKLKATFRQVMNEKNQK